MEKNRKKLVDMAIKYNFETLSFLKVLDESDLKPGVKKTLRKFYMEGKYDLLKDLLSSRIEYLQQVGKDYVKLDFLYSLLPDQQHTIEREIRI